MKVTYSVGRAIVEGEGEGVKECFDQLAGAAEIFGIQQCGCCDSREVVPETRENKGFTFRAFKCLSCGASIDLGTRRSDGQLFPKFRAEGTKNGWKKWQSSNPASDSDDSPF